MQQTITLRLDDETVSMDGLESSPQIARYPDAALAGEAFRRAAVQAAQQLGLVYVISGAADEQPMRD